MVEVASLLAAEETSEMFWGSLEAPQALSKETASVPARAALMTFFFMCIPLEKNNVCLPFLCTGRAQQTGQGSQNGTALCCISRFGRRYPFAAGCRNKKRRNQNKKA